jgi:hypothetical protein
MRTPRKRANEVKPSLRVCGIFPILQDAIVGVICPKRRRRAKRLVVKARQVDGLPLGRVH